MHREIGFYGEFTTSSDGKRRGFYPETVIHYFDAFREGGIHWYGVGGISPQSWESGELRQFCRFIQERSREYGLKMSSYHFSGLTFSEESPQVVQENMKAQVEAFAPWKPNCFVIHPAWIVEWPKDNKASYHNLCARHGEDYMLESIVQNMAYLADLLKPYGVSLAIETLVQSQFPLTSPEDCLMLVDLLHRDNVGICIDSGHLFASGYDPADSIRKCGQYVLETHFHDNMGCNIGEDMHLPVGFGGINWLDVQMALDEIGYTGPVTCETEGFMGQPTLGLSYRKAADWWEALEATADNARKKWSFGGNPL